MERPTIQRQIVTGLEAKRGIDERYANKNWLVSCLIKGEGDTEIKTRVGTWSFCFRANYAKYW